MGSPGQALRVLLGLAESSFETWAYSALLGDLTGWQLLRTCAGDSFNSWAPSAMAVKVIQGGGSCSVLHAPGQAWHLVRGVPMSQHGQVLACLVSSVLAASCSVCMCGSPDPSLAVSSSQQGPRLAGHRALLMGGIAGRSGASRVHASSTCWALQRGGEWTHPVMGFLVCRDAQPHGRTAPMAHGMHQGL